MTEKLKNADGEKDEDNVQDNNKAVARIAIQSDEQQTQVHAQDTTLGPFIADIVICIAFCVLLLVVPHLVEPFQRGFFCTDQSIRYPYKTSTVSTLSVILFSIGTVLLTVTGTEAFRVVKFSVSQRTNQFIIKFLTYFAHGIFGFILNWTFTTITKWTVGRLRPHFLAVCKPNVPLSQCKDEYEYINEYVCRSQEKNIVREARLSFFSGHASMAMGAAVFCALYMQARLPRRIYGVTILPTLQVLSLSMALFIGLSRIADNMHHWSDVLVGFIVGASVGYYSAVILGKVFERTDLVFDKSREANQQTCNNITQAENIASNLLALTPIQKTTYSIGINSRQNESQTLQPSKLRQTPTTDLQSTVLNSLT